MATTKKNKRWLSLFVAMMVILSFSLSSISAASGQVRTFRVRRSGDYALLGTIRVESDKETVNEYKYGEITFNDTISVNGKRIDSGAIFRYTISGSVKDGAKITLKYEEWCGEYVSPSLRTMTGKIHVEGHDCRILWKMDSFGTGFYFRNT